VLCRQVKTRTLSRRPSIKPAAIEHNIRQDYEKLVSQTIDEHVRCDLPHEDSEQDTPLDGETKLVLLRPIADTVEHPDATFTRYQEQNADSH